MQLLRDLFSTGGFMSHGHCYLWDPGVLWLHVISDALIALAYLIMPVTLLHIVRRRKDLPFDWILACIGAFVIACGATHALEIWTIWQPVYWLSGVVKAITAAASLTTAMLLVRIVPKLLALPSPALLQKANLTLESEIAERKLAEGGLRQSKYFLQSTLDALSAHIAILDSEGRIIAVNEAWKNFALANQWSEQNSGAGVNYLEVCEKASGNCSAEAVEVARGIRKVISGHAAEFQLEYPCHGPAEKRWFIVRVTRFKGSGPVNVVVSHENVTERKRAEEVVEEKDALIRIAGRLTRTGSWTAEMPGCQVFWSDEICDILEFPRGNVLELSEALARHPDPSREKIAAAMDACARDGVPFDLEVETITAHGRRIWGHVCGEAERDAGGSICRVHGAFQDITKHKQTEEALLLQQTELRTLFDLLPVFIWFKDTENRTIRLNERAANAAGKRVDEIEGRLAWETYPQEADKYYADDLEVIRSKEPKLGVVEILRDNEDRETWVRTSKVPYCDQNGEVIGIVVVSEDVTAHHQAERTLRESRAAPNRGQGSGAIRHLGVGRGEGSSRLGRADVRTLRH